MANDPMSQTDRPYTEALASTDYFEVTSSALDLTFAVWVTLPADYYQKASRFPVLYVLDGNENTARLGPLSLGTNFDTLEDFVPYIQVGIGFAGPDAEAADVLRNRIYVPPDEPIPPSLRSLLSQYSDSTEEYETLLQSLQDTHADLFLEFLETKLKSEIESRYRVVDEPAGLYGYSYSGLFSLYALFRRSSMFARVGVGSPGVLTADSKVFSLEQDLRNVDMPFRDTQLHMTLCELEMTGRTHVFRDLSIQYARLIDKLYLSEHKGLSFTARVLPNETHVTGVHASFLSFLRTCYAKTRDKLEL